MTRQQVFRWFVWVQIAAAILVPALPVSAQTCPNGTLLFKEDFGGNSVDDPRISTTPITAMDKAYYQNKSRLGGSMFAGSYLVTKKGYANGDTINAKYSQWYIQDDHTYPNDYTRGYFLQVDGKAGAHTFYTTELTGLCAGAQLYFSAYVANVFTYYDQSQRTSKGYYTVEPNLLFVISDAETGHEFRRFTTGPIAPDATLPEKDDWRKSSTWHQVSVSLRIPTGVSAVKLTISNSAGAGSGNDFALDDIEVRLCLPPVSVTAADTICSGGTTTFEGTFTNNGTFTEPLAYRWLYSTTGNLTSQDDWVTIGSNSTTLTLDNATLSNEGYYRLAVASQGGLDQINCRAMSDPIHLSVKEIRHTFPDTVCAGESYWFNGKTLTTAGTYTDTLTTASGCDSIVTLKLHVRDEIRTSLSQEICYGDSLLFGGKYRTQSGTYNDTLTAISGCDSIVTLALHIRDEIRTPLFRRICYGDSLFFGGTYRTQSGTYIDTLTDISGCDSIVTLTLQIRQEIRSILYQEICHGDSLLFAGQFRTQSGTYTDTLTTLFGCDSIVTLNLRIKPEIRTTYSHELCYGDSLLFGGKYRAQSGTYNDTLTTATGCDSVVVLNLQIKPEIRSTIQKRICEDDSFFFNNQYLNTSGYYSDTLQAVAGCDSIVTLELTVRHCEHVTACNDTAYLSVCDSIVAIQLSGNDTWTCATPTFALLTQPTQAGATAVIQADSLIYGNALLSHGDLDSLQYSINCDDFADTATIYLSITQSASLAIELVPNAPVCLYNYAIFSGTFKNNGTLTPPLVCQWQTSADDGVTWTPINKWRYFAGSSLSEIYQISDAEHYLFRLIVTEQGNESLEHCYVVSNILPIDILNDTETLTLTGCGRVEYDGITYTADTTFLETGQTTSTCGNRFVNIQVFETQESEQTILFCDTITYNGHLFYTDTTIIERYPATTSNATPCDSTAITHLIMNCTADGTYVEDLIINKYDWIMLCNNRKAYTLVPNYTQMRYQWYHNGERIDGATDDYYTENQMLDGCYMLRLLIIDDGTAHIFVSETQCVNAHALTIIPNPVATGQSAVIEYYFSESDKQGLYVDIYDNVGLLYYHLEPTTYPIVLPSNLAAGIYNIKVVTGLGQIFNVKLIVN
ncbi:MAG: T9SS type A sorting domain-containing protein [Paludibacteraceae bacterium]